MADLIDEIQRQLGKSADTIKGVFFQLAGLLAALPLSPQERSLDDIEGDPDRPTEIRSVTLCVMNDYLRPAIQGLQGIADYRPGQPPTRDPDFFDELREIFGLDLTALDGGGHGRDREEP